jgi:DNA-binding XRE family transcriptional regulator
MTGKELMIERRRLKVSQDALCERAGLTWQALTAIENEHVVPQTPSIDSLAALALQIATERVAGSQAVTA